MTSPKDEITAGVAEYERLLAQAKTDLDQAHADLAKSQADDASDDAAYEARIVELNKTIDTLKTQVPSTTLFGFYAGNGDNGVSAGARGNYDRVRGYFGDPQVYRMFYSGLPQPNFVGSNADYGPPVVVSFKAPPSEIVAGKHDTALKVWFASIPTARKVWWSYFHEPENDIEAGDFTPAQYRAAWDHVLALAPVRATLVPTLILMRYTLSIPTRRKVADYVSEGLKKAGNAVLAWDSYLNGGTTMKQLIDDPAAISASFGLGFAIAEISSNDATKRDNMVTDVVRGAKAAKAQFVTWFESNKSAAGGNEADWRLKPGTQGASVLKAAIAKN